MSHATNVTSAVVENTQVRLAHTDTDNAVSTQFFLKTHVQVVQLFVIFIDSFLNVPQLVMGIPYFASVVLNAASIQAIGANVLTVANALCAKYQVINHEAIPPHQAGA